MATLRSSALFLSLAALLSLPAALRAEEVAAPAVTLSDAERAALLQTLEQARAETEKLVARARGEVFARRPAPDRWSVSEVLEHIAATEALMFDLVQQALAAEPDPEWQKVFEAAPLEVFAERVRDRTQRAQAPEVVQPKGAQTRDEGLARYRSTREATLELVRTTQAPVKQHTAPVPGGKLTAQHFLTLIGAHNLRHNGQIAEVLEQLAVP